MATTAYNRITTTLEHVTGYTATTDGQWRCPAHDDHTPSLSVTNGDGRVLIHCHAGCELDTILATLKLTKADLYDTPHPAGTTPPAPPTPLQLAPRPRIVETYDYTDETGTLLYQVVRLHPKGFRQRRPDNRVTETGGWIWKLGDTRRVPYRLPQIIAAASRGDVVFVVEGERDVHTLEQLGHTATTNPGGAGKWHEEYSAFLVGAQVTIWADNDPPGIAHAFHVQTHLEHVGIDADVVISAHTNDPTDHIAAGHGFTDTDLPTITPPNPDPGPVTTIQRLATALIDWHVLFADDTDQAEWLAEPLIAVGRGHSLYAPAKAGKSLLLLDVAASLAAGRPILDQPAGPCRSVLYIDQEMGPDDLRERIEELGYDPHELDHLHYYQLADLSPLDTPHGGLELVELAAHHNADLVILDTLSRVIAGEENSADTLRNYYTYTGRPLKAAGHATLRADHAGKDLTLGQRGTSAKGDDVDVVWRLVPRDQDNLTVTATHRRMTWVPKSFDIARGANPLTHTRIHGSWPEGTKACADLLDTLGLPLDVYRRAAARALRGAGHAARNETINAALRYRRGSGTELGDLV